jgi:hypothetical protein
MSDIVERLRQGIGIGPGEHADAERTMDAAANEIERLRGTIARLISNDLVRLHDALQKIEK